MGPATADTLSQILANGNTSGGTNIVVSSGDVITTNTISETTAAAGVTIDGVLVKDGQVDGRDVSVDGTKLDTVETNADVTDTANVTAAGALMDSELTNIAAVKALNQGVATTDSPSFAGLTATTADINGGTIDGAVIGGASAAAGTFTMFTSTGIDDNATSTAITINSSENVGIGNAAPSYLLDLYKSASTVARVRNSAATGGTPSSTHGEFVIESTDGNMGMQFLGSTTANQRILFGDTGSGGSGQVVYDHTSNYMALFTNTAERMRIESGGVVRPGADNWQTLGSASYRWSTVYAGTGTINTSDEREKQQIAELDAAELRVAVAIKGLVKKYRYNDAVELKGDDARIHVGVIAQEVIAAFAAEGLDATRYALLCHDTWEAEPEETDDEGTVTKPARDAGERYGIRYNELLAFMIAAL